MSAAPLPFPLELFKEIHAELRNGRRFPFPPDLVRAAALVCEESGELIQAALGATRGASSSMTEVDVRREALHTAAVAVRLLIELDDFTARTRHREETEDGAS